VYHGVLAPNAKWRPAAVAYGRPATSAPPAETTTGAAAHPAPRCSHRHYRWADLMRRAFGLDVLACDHCGGRLRLLATIHDPGAIAAILDHRGLPYHAPTLRPARSPPHELWN
jgi:hypothetical protein